MNEHHSLSIAKVISDRDLREATINVQSHTLVDMLKTLLMEADNAHIKVDITTLSFTWSRDAYMPNTTTYRLTAEQ